MYGPERGLESTRSRGEEVKKIFFINWKNVIHFRRNMTKVQWNGQTICSGQGLETENRNSVRCTVTGQLAEIDRQTRPCCHWTSESPTLPANSSDLDDCRLIGPMSQLKGTCQLSAVVALHELTNVVIHSISPPWWHIVGILIMVTLAFGRSITIILSSLVCYLGAVCTSPHPSLWCSCYTSWASICFGNALVPQES